MKAILYRDDLGSKIDVVEIPEALQAEAEKWREKMIEVVAEADDTLTHKYLEGEALTTDGDPPRPPPRHAPVEVRARPHRLGPQEQGRPADARRGHRVPAVAARRPADDRPQAGHGPGAGPHRRRQGAAVRPRLQDRDRPVRRPPRVLPGLLGHAQGRLVRAQQREGQEGARRARPRDARQPPRGDQRDLRRRHRRDRRPQGHLHRRHPVRPGPPDPARDDLVPRAGHRGQGRAARRRPTRTRWASPSSASPRRTRPSASTRTRRAARPSSPAWASCTST